MKKALSYLLVFGIIYNIFMVNIGVFSYEFIDQDNEYFVNSLKNEIYGITDEYYRLYGENINSSSIGLYGGSLCPNGITVEGTGTISLEDYVAGVVTAENNWSDGGNIENMKAQAVAARTYGVINSNHCQSSIGNSQATQVYKKPVENSLAVRAAQETAGMVIKYNGQLFNPEYDAFCVIEKSSDSYTINQPSQYHSGQHQVIPASFINEKSSNHKGIDYCFGHGRGMSQVGSRYLSTQGYTFDQILQYYYPTGIEIVVSSLPFTSWRQGDPEWSSILLGNSSDSNMGRIGCLVTSFAITIAKSGVPTVLGDSFNPGTFVTLLKSNNGFVDGGRLNYYSISAAVPGYSWGNTEDGYNINRIKSLINDGYSVIISVPSRGVAWGHYVAIDRIENDQVYILDPATGAGPQLLNQVYSGVSGIVYFKLK